MCNTQLFWSAFFPHFPHLDGIRRDTEYLRVLNPNAGKCGRNADQNNSKYGHFLRINMPDNDMRNVNDNNS